MSSQHKAPLAAFFVVSIACIVVVVSALRSDALGGLFSSPTQVVIAGARLIPEPRDVLATEAKVVSRASAGIAAAPQVVHQVVAQAGRTEPATRSSQTVPAAPEPKHHQAHRTHRQAHHAPIAATAPIATHVVVPVPPVAPVITPPQQLPTLVTHGHGGQAHGWQAHGWQTHQTQTVSVPAYAPPGHQSDAAGWGPGSHGSSGQGSAHQWGKYDGHTTPRVDFTQTRGHDGVVPGAAAAAWSNVLGNGNGNGNGWGNHSSHGRGH